VVGVMLLSRHDQVIDGMFRGIFASVHSTSTVAFPVVDALNCDVHIFAECR
jgi:hypothetical protein